MDRPWHAFYSKNVPRTIVYPKTTLKELFNRNADNHPDKAHLVFKDVTLSYRVCNTMARALANGLLERGVVGGDRVALMMPNIPQYPIALMACYKLGANPEILKPGSVGVPWPDVDVRIVDPETGIKDMPPGECGEIIAKGPQIMAGYWKNPEETEKALKNGWLYTGDIGYMDEDGYIFILDRKKDMLICSGFNVYPREIDEVLYCHPGISEACAIGVPDEKRGQTVKAFVVPKPGVAMTAETLTDYCKERLAPYKVPKIMEFIDQLPRTPVGKPDRKALRLIHDKGG